MVPADNPASPAQKSGFKTSELFVSIAGLLAVIIPTALKVVPENSIAACILGVVGIVASYVGGRTALKMNGNKQAAMAMASQQQPGLRVPIEMRPPSP